MLELMLYILAFAFIHLFSILLIFFAIKKISYELSVQISKMFMKENTFGFIHPYYFDVKANEKVLWMTIKTLMEKYVNYEGHNKLVIFSHQENSRFFHINHYFKQFELEAQNSNNMTKIEIVKIKSLEYATRMKEYNYIVQILLQTIVSLEIIIKCPCYNYFDTTNLPFVYTVFKYFSKCKIIGFYHCPYIESSVINYYRMKKSRFNWINIFKRIYYYLVVEYYIMNGKKLDLIFFNSSITKIGILNVWNNKNYSVLYTPCNIQLYDEKSYQLNHYKQSSYKNSENRSIQRENTIVSFSQFREEKNHLMQIKIFQKVFALTKIKDLKLNIIGIVKTEKDLEMYTYLRQVVNSLNLQNHIIIEKDLSIEQIKQRFFTAKIGLHTQKDDISGATLIDMISAGLVVVAHRSGAPLYDIIGNKDDKITGILVDGLEEYSEQISEILNKYHLMKNLITASKESIQRFSHESFLSTLRSELEKFI